MDEVEDLGGRPREYNREEMTQAICERLATGEPLAVICRDIGISVRTVNGWRKDDPEIAAQFDEARDEGYDVIARRTRATARGKGEEAGGDSTGDVQRDKLIIDTDLKLLAKWDPRRYGEKQQLEHVGANGGPIQSVNLTQEQFAETAKKIIADV